MAPWFRGTETDPAKFSPRVQRYVHFVTGKESKRVVVLNHPNPKNPFKFLVHILLSMGRFSTGMINVIWWIVLTNCVSLISWYCGDSLRRARLVQDGEHAEGV
jgi:hypothetical protein